jgi:hypothetical protein
MRHEMTLEDLKQKLQTLKEEHSVLDNDILRLMEKPVFDQLAVQRLKKKKLKLKDAILKLQRKLIPDIIA